MEKSEDTFEIILPGRLTDRPVLVRPEQTTDGIPIYHCFLDGTSISQLRQEPSGEWVQIWGNFSPEIVQQLGARIIQHRG
ncbi:hypothetical protein ACFQRK_00930 [Parapedobacter sp. GCM10030251]|jgi:hypothetical protein|uniref:hypothetical protein n=1 Tax=Parapedobacter sp. GCM10030251 TaxID=3273419 RepID=UPI003612C901